MGPLWQVSTPNSVFLLLCDTEYSKYHETVLYWTVYDVIHNSGTELYPFQLLLKDTRDVTGNGRTKFYPLKLYYRKGLYVIRILKLYSSPYNRSNQRCL